MLVRRFSTIVTPIDETAALLALDIVKLRVGVGQRISGSTADGHWRPEGR